jgi:hypothetical protein
LPLKKQLRSTILIEKKLNLQVNKQTKKQKAGFDGMRQAACKLKKMADLVLKIIGFEPISNCLV